MIQIKCLIIMGIVLPSCFTTCKNLPNYEADLIEKKETEVIDLQIDSLIVDLSSKISIEEMQANVAKISHDSMQGRKTGSIGQKKTAQFIREKYIEYKIPSPEGIDYLQSIPESYFKAKSDCDSENVLAVIEGATLKDEVVVITAHYDHLGIHKNGDIYNGADDNGSGTVALLEIAKLFKMAKANGISPKRSVLFLHITGEEIGLYGSKFYTEHPFYTLENTIANLNIDMIGRIDEKHIENKDYVYLVGSDKISAELHTINENINEKYIKLSLDYKYNTPNDSLRIYYRSDQYNFTKNNIPAIFFFSGLHDDYHKVTDTYDKLDFDLIKKRSQLIFLTAWELANKESRLKIDSK